MYAAALAISILLLGGLIWLLSRARGAPLGYALSLTSYWLSLLAARSAGPWLALKAGAGPLWLWQAAAFFAALLICWLIVRAMPGLRQKLQGPQLRQAVWAATLSGLLLPLALFAAVWAYGSYQNARSLRHSREQYSPSSVLDPAAPAQYGVVVPANFEPPQAWRNTYGPKHVPVGRVNWQQYPDVQITIHHLQHNGYQGGSALALTPWDELVEQAAQEVAAGLAASGYTLYLGRGLKERWDGEGKWASYYEPVIVGLRDDALLRCRIVPDPRLRGVGSAPEIQIGVYTCQPQAVFGWSQQQDALAPLNKPGERKLFELVEGYLK